MESQFKKYPFSLDEFQKKAITAIESSQHVLVCAPTGSGKSLVAQHTVDWGLRQKKRVIYTTPIKSLSNQAYASLASKFGSDAVGIMTGDNQYNPGANVLIMTTEILRNFLLDGRTRRHESEESDDEEEEQYWYLDVCESVAAVVFDEVHYLQDPHRGFVWETCFAQMPGHVSMVMLSATIQNPHMLKYWIESIQTEKQVVICEHHQRAVPLIHSLFTDVKPTSKYLPDTVPKYRQKLVNVTRWSEPELLQYLKPVAEHYDWFQRGHAAIQSCVQFLQKDDKLPALCFILSRKGCERICQTWSIGLLEKDAIGPILRDWKKLVREACRGDGIMFHQIEGLPQYRLLTESLAKGVAFHHSGVVPILKECVEMLMKDGRVPCVFATETFAVGINSPTRTVIMSQIDKRTDGGVRNLEPHEYTQMAGRAGRRGMDTVGFVVSLPVSFVKKTSALQWHRMVHGDPVYLSSTQTIPIISVLRSLRNEEETVTLDSILQKVGERSMRAYEIESIKQESSTHTQKLTEEEQLLWDSYEKIMKRSEKTQGQRKKKQKKLEDWSKKIDSDVWARVKQIMEQNQLAEEESRQKEEEQLELRTTLVSRLECLLSLDYISKKNQSLEYKISERGNITCCFAQGNPLYQGYVAHTICWDEINEDLWDPLALIQFISLFRGSSIEAEEESRGITATIRKLFGSDCIKQLEESTRRWDLQTQRYGCWEPNQLYSDLVAPLESLREFPEDEWTFFRLQKITGWQEGALWKTINELVASLGEWQEVFGEMGQIAMYKKSRDAQKICRGLTLMIPSLYLQQNSLSIAISDESYKEDLLSS